MKGIVVAEPGFTYAWMRALVRVGIAHFARGLEVAPELATALEDEARADLDVDLGWVELRTRTVAAGEDRIARLAASMDLSLPDVFLLTLVGESEASHLLNLLIGELQAPQASARPTVHLAADIVASLFAGRPFGSELILIDPLVREGVVQIGGDGPTPLKQLCLHAHVWALLRGQEVLWPGCDAISAPAASHVPRALRTRIRTLRSLLDDDGGDGFVLRGLPGGGVPSAIAYLARRLGFQALRVPVRIWREEPILSVACKVAGWLPLLQPDLGPGERWQVPMHPTRHPVAIALTGDGSVDGGLFIDLEMPLPTVAERARHWRRVCETDGLTQQLASSVIVDLPRTIQIARAARSIARFERSSVTVEHVRSARYEFGADRLQLLAQPVRREVTDATLVLAGDTRTSLEEMAARALRREALKTGTLGVAVQATPPVGVRALFVGESGTGKTMAASYVAGRIGAPLFRVDLAAVMNKYIGESEKNLAALLDDAAAEDVVLLFDEAEDVFSRRSDVRGQDSAQHFSDMLTNFLLSRIENHPGVVILTTNRRERIDAAFMRRLDYVVEFPLPDFQMRLALWLKHLGSRAPDEHVSTALASYCDLPGGNIRNAVLNAASRQLDDTLPLATNALLAGIRAEYRKLGRNSPPELATLEAAS